MPDWPAVREAASRETLCLVAMAVKIRVSQKIVHRGRIRSEFGCLKKVQLLFQRNPEMSGPPAGVHSTSVKTGRVGDTM